MRNARNCPLNKTSAQFRNSRPDQSAAARPCYLLTPFANTTMTETMFLSDIYNINNRSFWDISLIKWSKVIDLISTGIRSNPFCADGRGKWKAGSGRTDRCQMGWRQRPRQPKKHEIMEKVVGGNNQFAGWPLRVRDPFKQSSIALALTQICRTCGSSIYTLT